MTALFQQLILLFFYLFCAKIINGLCTKLSESSDYNPLTTVCYQAVDYDFYLPDTTSLLELNTKAQVLLNNSILAILPKDCKESLLKLTCSNIYLKCSSDSNGNTHIYSDVGKTVPLPFERPCVSLCTDVSSKCLGLLNLFDLEPNCTSTYDYLFGYDSIYGVSGQYPYQYDQSNSNYCNNVSAIVDVASSYEPYLKSDTNGACAGIVTELYIPPSSAVDSSLSPILPTYAIQSIIEESIASSVNLLPKWLGESCHLALRKYFCGSYMLKPQLLTFESIIESFGPYASGVEYELGYLGVNTSALSTFNFYLPSYPSLEVCEDYASKCSGFIQLSGLSALIPNCSAKESNIDKFPNKTQTIIALSLAGQDVFLSTEPNDMSDTNDNDYEPSCPRGFVIPDDPSDSGVTFVPGSFSACALSCKDPMFTLAEYETLTRVSDIGSNVALPMVVFLLIVWMLDETRRKQYLVISFNLIALIVTIQCVYMSSIPFEKKYCRNNAVGISSRDGLRGCNVQSFFIVYFVYAEAINWCLISIDLFLKVAYRYNTSNYYKYYFPIMFLIPLISVGIMINKSNYGYSDATTTCQISRTNNWDIKLYILPIFIVVSIGFIVMLMVIYKIYKTSKNVKTFSNSKNKVKATVVVPVTKSAYVNSTSNHFLGSTSLDSLTTPPSQMLASQSLDKYDYDNSKDITNNSKLNGDGIFTDSEKTRNQIKVITKQEASVDAKVSRIPWKMIRTPLIFVILYFGVWFVIIFYRFQVYFKYDTYTNSAIKWTECAFTYYDGTNSWIKKCGEHPKERASYTLNIFISFIVNAHAIVVSGIFLLNPTIWFSYFDRCTSCVKVPSNFRSPSSSLSINRKT